jgi:hypothetical protein
MTRLSDFTSSKILERYRIAQTFHELRASGIEAPIAATQVSIRLGVREMCLHRPRSSSGSRCGGYENNIDGAAIVGTRIVHGASANN